MAENTFLGLQPYTEADAYRFKGRTEESQELFRLIVRNNYTVCYAESGEGKTSLLNAGVFPLLRQNMYFPIAITFTSDDYEHTPDSFDTIIDRCIKDSITEYNENNKGINIEYKLCSTDFQDTDRQLALQEGLSKYSWWKLRNYKPQAMGLTFTPMFVFDQFEEVFNLPGSIVWTKKFFDWLEDVSSDSCPDEIVNKVREIIGSNAAFPTIKEEKDFKAVFSLRKEFIGELDYWGMQKCFIPSLKDNRYCLKALTFEGAKNVMTQQERFEETKVEQVLHYFVQQYSREPEKTIEENLPVIPALLLSVVCDSWEKDINFFSGKDVNEIGQSLNIILERFYDEALSSITDELSQQEGNSPADSIRENIETAIFALVDGNGKRVRRKSSELSHLDFDAYYKEVLSDNRIIKISKVDGEDYVEIVHDSLCPIIAKRKELFLKAEAKKREEKKLREQAKKSRRRMLLLFGIIFIAIIIIAFFFYQNRKIEKSQWKMMENQARAVSEKAMPLVIENIDSYLPSILAINILPEDMNDMTARPYVPEAESLIRKASLCSNAIFSGHTEDVTSCSFSPTGDSVISSSYDKTIRLWDVKTGKCLNILKGHKEGVKYTQFSSDGSKILSVSNDSTVRIWETHTGKCIKIIKENMDINHAAFNSDGTMIAITTYDIRSKEVAGIVFMWNLNTNSIVWRQKQRGTINHISFSSNDSLLACTSESGTVIIRDSKSGNVIHNLIKHEEGVQYVSFSPDNKKVISSSSDGVIKIWNTDTWKCLHTFNTFNDYNECVSQVFFTNNEESFVSSSFDEITRIWNLHNKKCVETIKGGGRFVSISPNDDFFLFVSMGSKDILLYKRDVPTYLSDNVEGKFVVSPDSKNVLTYNKNTKSNSGIKSCTLALVSIKGKSIVKKNRYRYGF